MSFTLILYQLIIFLAWVDSKIFRSKWKCFFKLVANLEWKHRSHLTNRNIYHPSLKKIALITQTPAYQLKQMAWKKQRAELLCGIREKEITVLQTAARIQHTELQKIKECSKQTEELNRAKINHMESIMRNLYNYICEFGDEKWSGPGEEAAKEQLKKFGDKNFKRV